MTARFLVLDVGTTGLRAAVVDDRLEVIAYSYRANPPDVPFDGLVEFDATRLADLALDACGDVLSDFDAPVSGVGITNQRASTVVWDRSTGVPVAAGLGWQDLRTITECLTAKAEHDWTIAPNQSITKIASILGGLSNAPERDLCFGTIDSWLVWNLSGGATHVSDATNMSTTTTGLRIADGSDWDRERLAAFGIDEAMLPTVVDSAGVVAEAVRLPGSPAIAALVGDQQASLIGQGCVGVGSAKLTLGTGGMLDLVTGTDAPTEVRRNAAGTYALPTWQLDGVRTWGVEGIMLSAGTNVEWIRDDLGLIETSEQSHDVASECRDTGGVVYVPALLGLGTPFWDYGARGTLLGLTRGTERAHVVRAVLEGVAHRSADIIDAANTDASVRIESLRLDGGMSQNPTVVQSLADATGLAVEVSPTTEATTRGAAFLTGLALGHFTSIDDAAELWQPAAVVHPDPTIDRTARRSRWSDAVGRSGGWYPELSALDF